MASTFSPLLQIELMGIGDQNNSWGTTNNTNLGTLIEQAIAGTAELDVTAADKTLTVYDGSSDEARCAALRVHGTPGVSRNIIAPAHSKIYVVANGSDADIVLKTSTSTGLTIPSGEIYLAYFDTILHDFKLVGKSASSINSNNTLVLRDATGSFGANIIAANEFVGDITGNVTGNLDGNLTGTAPTAPTAAPGTNTTQVATTAFVQNVAGTLGTMSTQNANNVNITGGTISGINLTATNIANTGGWSVTPSGTTLYFNYNGVNVAKLDSSGNLTVKANVTAYGTV